MLLGGIRAVRKRPIMLAAAALAVGLAVLGTVVAQQPILPPQAPPVRPYNDWTSTPPQPGYMPTQPASNNVQPAGGNLPQPAGYPGSGQPSTGGQAPRLPNAPGSVTQAGYSPPPPSMDIMSFQPAAGVAPQATAPVAPPAMLPPPGGLSPPKVSIDPASPQSLPVVPSNPVQPVVPGLPGGPVVPDARSPLVPVPPLGQIPSSTSPGSPAVPTIPTGPLSPVVPLPPGSGMPRFLCWGGLILQHQESCWPDQL
jgi:collagen type IV alpha